MLKNIILFFVLFSLTLTVSALDFQDNREIKLKNNIELSETKLDNQKQDIKNLNQKYFDLIQAQKDKIYEEQQQYNKNKQEYYDYKLDKILKYITALTESIGTIKNDIKEINSEISNIKDDIVNVNDRIDGLAQQLVFDEQKIAENLDKIKLNAMDIENLNKLKVLTENVSLLNRKINVIEVKVENLSNLNTRQSLNDRSIETDISYLTGETQKLENRLNNIAINKKEFDSSDKTLDISEYNYNTEKKRDDVINRSLINLLFEKAQYSFNNKEYEKALFNYKEIIKYDNTNVLAYYNAGITLYLLKRYEEALDYFNKVIQLNPNEKEAYVYAGILYYKFGDLKKSAMIWNQLLKIDPNNNIALKNIQKIKQRTNIRN